MTKKTTDTTTPARRPRRASLPITDGASQTIDKIAEVFGIPKTQVRERAARLASEAVEERLPVELGRERADELRKELKRIEDATRVSDPRKADD